MRAVEHAVVGHFAVGPMKALCLRDAPTPAAVRARLAGRWIADVRPITSDVTEVVCAACGAQLT